MSKRTPIETVQTLTDALNKGNLKTALALYEPQAVMVVEPGKIAAGKEALREALAGFIALKPALRGLNHQVIEIGDIALLCLEWTLAGTAPDGTTVNLGGKSCDILRRQKDGSWRIVLDNPWGVEIIRQ